MSDAGKVITVLTFNPITVLWAAFAIGHFMEFDHQWWTIPFVITILILLGLSCGSVCMTLDD